MGVMSFTLSDQLEEEIRTRNKKHGDLSIMAQEAFVDYLRKLENIESGQIASIMNEELQNRIDTKKKKQPDRYEELKAIGYPEHEIDKIIDGCTPEHEKDKIIEWRTRIQNLSSTKKGGKIKTKKITVSLPDFIEEELRSMAKEGYSGMRGSLSIITTDALIAHFKQYKNFKGNVE